MFQILPPLCLAAHLSNDDEVRALIDAGVDVNKTDGGGKTALFYAIQQSNNENVVHALIDTGVDVNKTDGDGKTALFYAIQQSNNENVVCALIDAGVDVNKTDGNGKTALFYAVQQSNNKNVVHALIDAGSDLNKSDSDGKTALFYAVQQSNNENVVRALINAGSNVYRADCDGKTVLFYAVQQSNNENVVHALIDAGSDVNKSAWDGKTALFYAVQQSNNENVVCALIDAGSDVNRADCDLKTALLCAIQHRNNKKVLHALSYAGVDVNKTDGDGKTALLYAIQQSNNEKKVLRALTDAGFKVNKTDGNGKTALFYAVQQSDNENVVHALIDAGVDVNKTDGDGKTALFYAVQQSNNENVIHALIDAGSDVNNTDDDGKTALFYAVQQSNNENVVHTLIDAGSDVNKSDDDGKTALFYALQQDYNANVVLALIIAGSDINISAWDGKTALFYAVQQSNNKNVVHALIDAGVDVNKSDGDGKTALFYALQQSNNENVVRALIDAGTDLNKTDHEGQTALFYAVQQNNNENVVPTLISGGNNSTCSIKDRYGRTPLFYAWKCPMILSYLLCEQRINYLHLKDNCNVNILTFFQEQFALSSAFSFERYVMPEIFYLFMRHGVKQKEFAKVILNLIFSKIPNTLVYDETVSSCTMVRTLTTSYAELIPSNQLMKVKDIKMILDSYSIKEKILEVIELLLELGADPNSADSQGNIALHYITRLPLFDVPQGIVMDMLYKLDELRTSLDIKNHEGQNPLLFCLSGYVTHAFLNENQMLLSMKALVEICTFLVKRGCRIQETTQSGESVGHLLMKLLQKCLKLLDQTLRNDILHEAIKLMDLFTLEKAVKAKLGNKTDSNLNSPLHLWASFELPSPQNYTSNITRDHTFETFLKQILQNLLKCGAKLNARNENEETPLHLCRTWSAVKLLIGAGANPKDVDSSGRSTLLVAAKNKLFLKNHDNFYPDITVDQNSFWEKANEKGLDLWTVDKNSDSVLSCLIQSESYLLAKALVEVACEESYTLSEMIFASLLNAICKDKSTSTQWKAILIKDLLKSRKSPSSASKALHFCCENLIEFCKTTDPKAFRSPERYGPLRDDEARKGLPNDSAMQNSVHFEIAKLLLWSGADPGIVDSSGKSCLDIADTCPELKDLLTKPVDINSISLAINWISVSKKYEGRLAKVARLQEYEVVDSFWYHKECIGSGSFGHVFAGINNKDGREVAMKRIETLRMNRPEDKREITNLTMLADCEQVVRYLYFIEEGDFCFIVLELMEGNLDDMFKELCHRLTDVTERCKLCKDVVMGVKFLHERNIIHRDLKPTNILYKCHPELCLKIADFGLSLCMDSIGKTTVYGTNAGTRCWIAPEVLKSANHTKSSDMFSCGLLLHYILSLQKHPFGPVDFAAKNENQIAFETEMNVVNGKMEGWDTSLSPEATDLVGKMLANEDNIIDRPTASEALHHPLFWPKEKKIDLLIAVGNQLEFECPRARRTLPLTAVEIDLEKNFNVIVRYRTWNDPGYTKMPAIYAEMTPPRRRTYDTSSVVELVRFIRNAYIHVSDYTRPTPTRKMLLEDFVFLEYYPQLLMEVYIAVTTHGWDQTKEEVKYAMNK